jgi:hypothetical protein
MATRLRSTWLAGGSALLLVLAISGMAAGATLVADTAPPVVEPDTTLTFEDTDGNGVDDDCQDVAAVAAPDAEAAALEAADSDGDGTISVSEAAHTDWIGGKNCNHGGYVSWVANGEDCDEAEVETPEAAEGTTDESTEAVPAVVATCDEETEEADEAVSPTILTFEDVNGDGIDDDCAVSEVVADPAAAAAAFLLVDLDADGTISTREAAHSKWVGGTNCNHGGFVSWVAHNKADGPEDPDAAKKDRTAKDALKAAKEHAAKDTKANKGHGKGHGR